MLRLLNQEHFKTWAKNRKILRIRLGEKVNFPCLIGSAWNSAQNNNCGVQSYTNFFLALSQTFEFSSGLSFSSVQLANCPNSSSKCHNTTLLTVADMKKQLHAILRMLAGSLCWPEDFCLCEFPRLFPRRALRCIHRIKTQCASQAIHLL